MIKIEIGSVVPGVYMEIEIHGRDLNPDQAVTVTDADIQEAMPSIKGLIEV